jgi:hypothetical protein
MIFIIMIKIIYKTQKVDITLILIINHYHDDSLRYHRVLTYVGSNPKLSHAKVTLMV